MWLLDRLCPDHKPIAEFRRRHREAITASGSEFARLARSVGLIRGDWILLDPKACREAKIGRGDRVQARQLESKNQPLSKRG
jgi:hypothetical protein